MYLSSLSVFLLFLDSVDVFSSFLHDHQSSLETGVGIVLCVVVFEDTLEVEGEGERRERGLRVAVFCPQWFVVVNSAITRASWPPLTGKLPISSDNHYMMCM